MARTSSTAKVPSPTVPLRRDSPALAAFVRVLANLTDAMAATWQGTISGTDPEMLHQLRVAIRRSRSVLAEAKGVVPPDVRSTYREELRWLGLVTGPTRDLDVYAIEWEDYVSPLDPAVRKTLEKVRVHLAEQRKAAQEALVLDLQSERAETLLAGWLSWLAKPGADGAKKAEVPIVAVASQRIELAQGTVLDRGRSITASSPADELHELRKDAKKLRYLLECFGDLYPSKRRSLFVKELKALQDNLGQHQDAEVHVDQLGGVRDQLEAAGVEAVTLDAIDALRHHLDEVRLTARAEFASRFAAYDTKPNRAALRQLIGSG